LFENPIKENVNRDTFLAGVSMKTFARSLALLSSVSFVAIGCAQDEADDLSSTDDALVTCGGWHHGGADRHRGHHHNRHHHGHTGAGGSRPHLTGTGGMGGGMTGGMGGGMMGGAGGGMAGTTGSAGTSGDMGGSGGAMVDPRCAPMDGMISWWHGDDDYDDAVGSNDGLTAGQVTFAPGIDHDGFNFNGMTGSFVEVPDDASLSPTELTIDAWINAQVLGGRIVDKITPGGNDGYLLDLVGDHLRVIADGNSITSASPIPAGMFVHVATVRTRTSMKLYINGVLDADAEAGFAPLQANNHPFRIGADGSGGSLFMGVIDEPRIFGRGLSDAEIQTLFWQGSNCQ
jgi:hypothetical protein